MKQELHVNESVSSTSSESLAVPLDFLERNNRKWTTGTLSARELIEGSGSVSASSS